MSESSPKVSYSIDPAFMEAFEALKEQNKLITERLEGISGELATTKKVLKKHSYELRDGRFAQGQSVPPDSTVTAEGAPGPAPGSIDWEAQARAAREVVDLTASLPAEAREQFNEITRGMTVVDKAKFAAMHRMIQPQAAPIAETANPAANGHAAPTPVNGRGTPPARVNPVQEPRDYQTWAALPRAIRDELDRQNPDFDASKLPYVAR